MSSVHGSSCSVMVRFSPCECTASGSSVCWWEIEFWQTGGFPELAAWSRGKSQIDFEPAIGLAQLRSWCSNNSLELNTVSTVELIIDFRRALAHCHRQCWSSSTVPSSQHPLVCGTVQQQPNSKSSAQLRKSISGCKFPPLISTSWAKRWAT